MINEGYPNPRVLQLFKSNKSKPTKQHYAKREEDRLNRKIPGGDGISAAKSPNSKCADKVTRID